MSGLDSGANCICLTKDQNKAAIGTYDSIFACDMTNYTIISQILQKCISLESIAFSSDENFIVSGSYNGRVIIWSLCDGREVKEFKSSPYVK